MRAAAEVPWLETHANVTACRYQFARLNTFTLGVSTDNGPFVITYTYYAHGQTYTDEFTSPTYLEQGTIFTITYNPLNPQQNSRSASSPMGGRIPLLGVAIAGSILLSLLYLVWMHGCA